MKNNISNYLSFLIIFVLFSIILTINDASFGDGSIFADAHNFILNGNILYEGVWDHKDYGYFLIGKPFYFLFGISGLYILGLISLFCFCISVWHCTRLFTNNFNSLLLTVISLVFYSGSFGFSPLQPEFLSINFLIAGATLIISGRYIGSILLALAVVIKISSILPVFFFFVSFYIIGYLNHENKFLKKLFITMTIFMVTVFGVVVLSYLDNTLSGWLEITSFNLFYSDYVRLGNKFNPTDPASFILANIRVLFGIYAYAGKSIAIAISLNFFLLFFTFWFLKKYPKVSIRNFINLIVPYFGILLGCYLAMLSQAPPADHHYIYILAPLLVLILTMAANLMCLLSITSQKVLNIVISIVIIVYMIFLPYKTGMEVWIDPYRNAQLKHSIGLLEKDQTFAILRGNHHLQLGPNQFYAKLKCRHFYQLEHIIEFYENEILSCIKSSPDFIFVNESEINILWKSRVSWYYEKILPFINANYKICDVKEESLNIYVKRNLKCPI
jgi:hypothetical protein